MTGVRMPASQVVPVRNLSNQDWSSSQVRSNSFSREGKTEPPLPALVGLLWFCAGGKSPFTTEKRTKVPKAYFDFLF
jgi:hypothetical protein